MYRHLKAYLVVSMLLLTLATLGGTVSAYPSSDITFYTYSDEEFINQTLLADYYRNDDRVENYIFESFDGADFVYDYSAGVSNPSKTGGDIGAQKTNVDEESFNWEGNEETTGAMWFNFTDGETSVGTTPVIFLVNGTEDDNLDTFEFDFLLEDDTELVQFCTLWHAVNDAVCINITEDGGNATAYTSFTNPDVGQSFNRTFDSGVWHHVIMSYTNNLVRGFEVIVFVDNASVIFEDSRQDGIASASNLLLYVDCPATETLGRDVVIDNYVMYNGSFTKEEIETALSGTFISSTLIGILPVMITIAVIGMLISVVKKIKD